MLAAIHGVDLAAVGLTGFGRPAGYLERQLARWQRQWELSATREMPGYPELVQRLAAGLPAGSADGTLVHGDYRLDNMLVTLDARPAVAAVLDWEMSTLGDPLADLGLALVYWAEPGDGDSAELSVAAMITASPGFLSRAQIADRYAAPGGTCPGSATTWPSAASSSPWCWRASTRGSCSIRPWGRGSSGRARACQR